MSLTLTAPPAVEPISLAEAKAHLRVDGSAEDTLIGGLIPTSRLHVETALGLALITQGWSWRIDAWPDVLIDLPLRPVQAVSAVRVTAHDGSIAMIEPGRYLLDGDGLPPRLIPTGPLPAPGVPAGGIEIAFTAGFGNAAASVPAPIRQALLILIAHWFDNREPVRIGTLVAKLPDMVSELLAPYRVPLL